MPETKHVTICDLSLVLAFAVRLRDISVDLCLRRLPSLANCARCCSAGSTNPGLESRPVWTERIAISLYAGCSRTASGGAGPEAGGASEVGVVRDGFSADSGEGVVVVRERYGITSLVEDRLLSLRASRGVFGLSGGESCVPTVERPENIWRIPARTLATLAGEG
jgi:hypothetical protein